MFPTATAAQQTAERQNSGLLQRINVGRDRIQVEVMFVERHVDDPLLGDDLWKHVGQVGAVTARTRAALEQNGLRIGHIGSVPPPALETLLNLQSPFAADAGNGGGIQGRRISLRSGGETEIQTTGMIERAEIALHTSHGPEVETFEQARCLFRVKAERREDGWATLEFTPEIHHGSQRLRHVATPGSWQLRTAQEVQPLFQQRFSVTLNIGEMALVTAAPDSANVVGRSFFIGTGADGQEIQRLLIVRLAEMSELSPIYE